MLRVKNEVGKEDWISAFVHLTLNHERAARMLRIKKPLYQKPAHDGDTHNV